MSCHPLTSLVINWAGLLEAECVRQDCDEPAHGECRLFGSGLVESEDGIHPAHVRRERHMREDHQQQRQQRVGVAIRAQVAANVRVAHERPQDFEIVAMDDGPHADAGIRVDLQGRRAMQCAVAGIVGEVRHPGVEQVGQELEERSARVEFADAVLHVRAHPLAADVGDVGVEVAFVGEVLEQAALGDSGTLCDDVEAALGEAVRAELRLRGFYHRGATSPDPREPMSPLASAPPRVDDHWSYYCEARHRQGSGSALGSGRWSRTCWRRLRHKVTRCCLAAGLLSALANGH